MCFHCMEVCTHLDMVRVGSCQKCGIRNWRDVLRDNLWSDSAMGDFGSRGGGGGSVTEG